jgi:outer membrane lipoprotein-sorting protein
MLSALMLAAALTGTPPTGTPPDPLASAIAHYRTVESYRVTIHSTHADGEEYIRYYYKKPGFVRMEFIRPHAGAVLIYNPYTQSVRLWPFGVKHFPELSLSPGNPLIRSSRGQRVDHSDVGTLFENVRALREGGNAEVSGKDIMDGRTVTHLIVTGAGNFVVAGVHRHELWLDTESQFPVKGISRDRQDAIIETVMMEALEINATLPETLFNP